MKYPRTHKEAREINFKHYYNGKPCKNGHTNLRYASSMECVVCRKEKNNTIELRNKQNEWYEKNKEKKNASRRKKYHENIDKVRERYKKKWLFNKEKIKIINKNWIKNNPEKYKELCRIRSSKKRLVIKNQMPKWANINKIKEIYKNRPKGYHVDHIIPLRGKYVSGLHVENNLQYLTVSENCKKRNTYTGV